MITGVPLMIVAGLIIAIWVIIEIKRFKHKLFAIFLVVLILFAYLSFTLTIKDNVDLKSTKGLKEAGEIYFSWLSTIFGNLKHLTANAIKLDWSANSTTQNK